MPTPIAIHAINGSGPSSGFAELRERPLRDRLRYRDILLHGRGTPRWPLASSCSSCGIGVRLTPG